MELPKCLNKKKELENKSDTSEKEETINRTSADHPQNVEIADQDKNEMLDKEDQHARKSWISRVFKRNLDGEGKRKVQASMFLQITSRHQSEIKYDRPQNAAVLVGQEKNGMLDKEEKDTRYSPVSLAYNIKGKDKRQAKAPLFSNMTSGSKGQHRDIQISPATITRAETETVAAKSSSRLKPVKKGRGRKLQAFAGSSSSSVPRKRNRKSGIEEIEDAELNSRRWTYLLGKNDKSALVLDSDPKEFESVNSCIGYEESLLRFSKNLGPTAQRVASKKLKLLRLTQATAPASKAQVPHPSKARRLSDDTEEKSEIIERGRVRNSVSVGDERPTGPFLDASGIRRSADVFHRAVRENVHCPTHNHGQSILQQQQPPNISAVANAYTLRPGNQVPIAYEARPKQSAYSSTNVWPSRLSTMCHASSSSFRVWGGHHTTPVNELQRPANPAALARGFQQSLHNSHTQLQNQLGSQVRQQQQMALEQQYLPMLSNMLDRGTSHAGTSSPAPNHQTTSNAAPNGQQMPSADSPYLNLELQLGTKPSPTS